MLLNVTQDSAFQRYLDQAEKRLYVDGPQESIQASHDQIRPPIAHAMRLYLKPNGAALGEAYLIKRGKPILFQHYRVVYRDMYRSVDASKLERKAIVQGDGEGLTEFMEEQLAWLESEAETRIRGIAETAIDEVRQRVMEGVRAGRSNAAITRDLYDAIPELSRVRAETIARTETHNAALAAIEKTFQAKDIEPTSKTWWTVNDNRVREDHREVHGVTVPYDGYFVVGGMQMSRPGDPAGGAAQVVGCRCSVLYNL